MVCNSVVQPRCLLNAPSPAPSFQAQSQRHAHVTALSDCPLSHAPDLLWISVALPDFTHLNTWLSNMGYDVLYLAFAYIACLLNQNFILKGKGHRDTLTSSYTCVIGSWEVVLSVTSLDPSLSLQCIGVTILCINKSALTVIFTYSFRWKMNDVVGT